MYIPRIKWAIICFSAILLTVLSTAPVMAADFRADDTITISSNEVFDDDLYIAGNEIIIDGVINGDVWAVGNTININGAVKGSIVAVGDTIIINGEITHAARLAGRTIDINGNINGDLLAFGDTINIASTANTEGDLITMSNYVRISGPVTGDIKGGVREIIISSEIGGNIDLKVDTLTVTSTANIHGNLSYTAENEANIDSAAFIGGEISHNMPEVEPAKGFFAGLASAITGKIIGFLMLFIIGLVLILLIPRRIISMADSIKGNLWLDLGWGAIILFLTPIAAIVICFTVIGIPLGLITLALYGIALYLSQIPVALCIGRTIIKRSRETESKSMQVGAFAAGLAILAVLRAIPFIGFFIWLAAALFGLGTLVTSKKSLRLENGVKAST